MEIDHHFMTVPFEYIVKTYNVPAEYGREILFEGKRKGVIVKDYGNYIGACFHDRKVTQISTLHPTSEVEYLGIVKPRKMSRSQLKYQEWREADTGRSFAEYIGIKKKQKQSFNY